MTKEVKPENQKGTDTVSEEQIADELKWSGYTRPVILDAKKEPSEKSVQELYDKLTNRAYTV